MFLEVKYKCGTCSQQERTVLVPEREQGEGAVPFMQRVQNLIAMDHNHLSPRCTATKMEYAKIPLSEGKGIGEK